MERADGVCESCGEPTPFRARKGPYLECHHLCRLADGGPDYLENVIGLCPNCHRRAHFGVDRQDLMNIQKAITKRKERQK